MISLKENVWKRQSRFSVFQFTVLTVPVLELVLQFTCSWKSFIHMTRRTELRHCPHWNCQLLWTRLFGFIPWSPSCFQPTDTTRAHLIPLLKCEHVRQVFWYYWGFKKMHSFLLFCDSIRRLTHAMRQFFPYLFSTQRKGEKKPQTISQQT